MPPWENAVSPMAAVLAFFATPIIDSGIPNKESFIAPDKVLVAISADFKFNTKKILKNKK